MGFSAKQIQALRRNLNAKYIRTRHLNGRELSYIEGWHAIAEANRVFGHDGWNRETVDTKCVLSREIRGTFQAVYIAKVRITVRSTGHPVIREGHGSGEAKGGSPGEVHDIALKAAETDATKRALATFGKPFGLALYLKPPKLGLPSVQANGGVVAPAPAAGNDNQPAQALNGHPIAKQAALSGLMHTDQGLIPASQIMRRESQRLMHPVRRRDREHLRFVASQPCLICGRSPSDPHHLRFMQPRATGLKVSDEFTVPLCRTHHRQLHHAEQETKWWEAMEIDATAIAKSLWDESRGEIPAVAPAAMTAHDSR